MPTLKNIALLVILITCIIACDQNGQNSAYQLVYKNDKNGDVIYGSKNALINAIRGGASLRVGWGAKGENHSIEHLSEPIWVAILDEEEVIVHLDAQVLSKVDWENLSANYADSTLALKEWRVVITTKGQFDAIWYNRKEHVITERRPQNHVMSWFVKDFEGDANIPLFSTESTSQ